MNNTLEWAFRERKEVLRQIPREFQYLCQVEEDEPDKSEKEQPERFKKAKVKQQITQDIVVSWKLWKKRKSFKKEVVLLNDMRGQIK